MKADITGIKAAQAASNAKVDRIDQKVDSVIKQQIDMQHDVSMLRYAFAPVTPHT